VLFSGINVVSIVVPDLAAAREFYGSTLGLGEPLYDLPAAGWIEFGTGGAGNLALTLAEPGQQAPAGTTVVLNVADCRAAWRILRERGFPGFVTFCSFYDPFGNRLQMCSPLPEE
jgi:catechol 2,3-dioxygenase-like lactoylglutathione lyase family enzyme